MPTKREKRSFEKSLSISINTYASSCVCATNLDKSALNSDIDTEEALIMLLCCGCINATQSSETSTIVYGEIQQRH